MQSYNSYLREITNIMGHSQTTFGTDLATVGKILFGPLFRGTFARDEAPHGKGFFILNLDKRAQPGSHWIAVANGMVYDSFGRGKMGFSYASSTDPDAEQNVEEDNCGQRSLAWLCVYFTKGPHVAKTI